ncbi:unnamed protein product [Trichobilharzia szidati]|nr:unnamed protein product [Trichobilharzia szidati]
MEELALITHADANAERFSSKILLCNYLSELFPNRSTEAIKRRLQRLGWQDMLPSSSSCLSSSTEQSSMSPSTTTTSESRSRPNTRFWLPREDARLTLTASCLDSQLLRPFQFYAALHEVLQNRSRDAISRRLTTLGWSRMYEPNLPVIVLDPSLANSLSVQVNNEAPEQLANQQPSPSSLLLSSDSELPSNSPSSNHPRALLSQNLSMFSEEEIIDASSVNIDKFCESKARGWLEDGEFEGNSESEDKRRDEGEGCWFASCSGASLLTWTDKEFAREGSRTITGRFGSYIRDHPSVVSRLLMASLERFWRTSCNAA